MSFVPFQTSSTLVHMRPCPIEPTWVREGRPLARVADLFRSADDTAFTVVWDCTAGSFEWIYGCDETIHILEGSVTLQDGGNPPRQLGPGDAVFFPKGSRVRWEVESYVKKIAFLRHVLPRSVTGPVNLARRMKRLLRGQRVAAVPGMLGAEAS